MAKVISFWRGEEPLGHAFWLWGVAAWIFLIILRTYILASPLSVALLVVDPIYLVFSAVGIFRSADRYSGKKAYRLAGLVVPVAYAGHSILGLGSLVVMLLVS